jgi:purine-binding chemotaxis protein CheW
MTDTVLENNSLQAMDQVSEGAEQYLTFVLDNEEYGVEILRVQEIKGWDTITPIPNTPHYLCGVLNLRGTIVPVVDLRLRFNMPFLEYTPTTVIVVLRVEGVTQRTVGIVVDAMSDSHNVMPDEVKPVPDFGTIIDTEYLSGLVKIDKDMVMLLDIDRLLDVEAIG